MNALRAMYGLRRVCLAVTSFLMSANTIHLLNLPSESAAGHLSQGLQDLQAMSVNHQFAARCVEIIRSLATKWSIALPETVSSVSALRGAGARPWPSPPSSTFFAASIPRKQSSADSGTRSADSATRRQDGPFNPPHAPPPPQQVPAYYSDPSTPVDPTHGQSAFWTPFPVQGVPTQPQSWNNMMFDFTSQTEGMQQWPLYAGSAGPPGHEDISQHPTPTSMPMDETMGGSMGGAMGDWSWQ
ncbi:hypothetical protein LTR85_010040 [Meristemomyces frigidus]|nr:hypothetical protein LTR85_010040 [Meristemomyces frigidus]